MKQLVFQALGWAFGPLTGTNHQIVSYFDTAKFSDDVEVKSYTYSGNDSALAAQRLHRGFGPALCCSVKLVSDRIICSFDCATVHFRTIDTPMILR